jgi:D-xylose transport system substrate-binding protein
MNCKRWFAAVVVAAMLPACGGGSDNANAPDDNVVKGKIAVLFPDKGLDDKGRWEYVDRPFLEQSFKTAGLNPSEFTIYNAENDPQRQIDQATQAVADGAKTVIFVPVDQATGVAAHAKLTGPGVKVIDYDRLVLKGRADYYVGFDNEAVGRLQGEGLVRCVQQRGKVNPKIIELNGGQTDSSTAVFKKGYDSVLDPMYQKGWIKVADEYVAGWKKEEAVSILQRLLPANRDIDGILVANDNMADAAIATMKAQSMNVVPVTGQDASLYAVQHILAGEQCMTVYKPIQASAGAVALLALDLRDGKVPSNATGKTNNGTSDVPSLLLPPVSVTKENIRDTVIKDQFIKVTDLCTGEYADACTTAGIR